VGTYVVAPMPNAPGAPLPPLPQVPLPWLADVGRMFESDSVSSNSDELWKLIGVGFRTAYHRRKHARMTGFFDGLHLYAYFCAMNCAWALLCELSTYLVLFNAALIFICSLGAPVWCGRGASALAHRARDVAFGISLPLLIVTQIYIIMLPDRSWATARAAQFLQAVYAFATHWGSEIVRTQATYLYGMAWSVLELTGFSELLPSVAQRTDAWHGLTTAAASLWSIAESRIPATTLDSVRVASVVVQRVGDIVPAAVRAYFEVRT
jgi:hypothetical protein